MATEATSDGPEKDNKTSNIIFIRNLVRPFTLVRLKELLEKNGKLVEDQFWIDKIKSKCYATYEKEEDAINTREALNGISWPDANPKKLIIDFATKEELEYHLNLDKNPPPSSSSAPPQSAPPSSTSSRARTYSKPDIVNEQKESSKKELNNDKFDAVIRRGKLEKLDPETSKDHKESSKQEKSEKSDKSEKSEKSERQKRPIREWDKEKFSQNEQPPEETSPKKKRAASASPENKGRRIKETQHKDKDRDHKDSVESDGDLAHKDGFIADHKSPAKLLDDLYKKTKATPCIYWLPLDEVQAKKRAELRAENLKKKEKELAARRTSRFHHHQHHYY